MSDASIYERFFKEADVDGSGYLTLKELTEMLRKKGYRESDDKIRAMFNSVDTSGDNKISLEEYKIAMGLVPPQKHKAATMRSVFRSFDKNGDGKIDRAELDSVFKSMGRHLSAEDINKIISAADKDKSGTLDYEEFIEQVFGVKNG